MLQLQARLGKCTHIFPKCLKGRRKKSWGQKVEEKGKMKDYQESRRPKRLVYI